MKKFILLFSCINLVSLYIITSDTQENLVYPTSCIFDFTLQGNKNSAVWQQIIQLCTKHINNYYLAQNKNKLSISSFIDESLKLTKTVFLLCQKDTSLIPDFGYQYNDDISIYPETLDAHFLIIRFYITPQESGNQATKELAQLTINSVLKTIKNKDSISFDTVAECIKKLQIIANIDDSQSIKIGITMWYTKDK